MVGAGTLPAQPPTWYAATGLYCFDNSVFDKLGTLEPSARGQPEITDINNAYIAAGQMNHTVAKCSWVMPGIDRLPRCGRRGASKPASRGDGKPGHTNRQFDYPTLW